MSYDPISYLGLNCPSGGDPYICQDSEVKFLGCCDVDPCGSKGGKCPSSSVRPTGFDPDKYFEIPAQSCVSSNDMVDWYTCTNSPTFLGCCTTNPCMEHGECPEENLVGAVLSHDSNDAEVFLSSTASTISTTPTSALSTHMSTSTATSTNVVVTSISSSTSNPTSSPTTYPVSGKDSGAPIGGIVGGILGGLGVLGLVLLAFFLYRRRRKRAFVTTQLDNAMATPPQPWSPYQGPSIFNLTCCHDTHQSEDQFGQPPPVSPLSTPSTPRGLSATLGSIVGLKQPGKKKWSFLTSSGRNTVHSDWTCSPHDNSHMSQGFLTVSELDGSPRHGIILAPGSVRAGVFEVEGSVPDARPKEMVG